MATGLQDERVQGVLAVVSEHFETVISKESRDRYGIDEQSKNIQAFAQDWQRAAHGIDFSAVFDDSGRGRRLAETFQEMTAWAEKAAIAPLTYQANRPNVFHDIHLAVNRIMAPLVLQLSADVVAEEEVPEELLEQFHGEINRNEDLASNVHKKMHDGYDSSGPEDFGALYDHPRIVELSAVARQESAGR